MTLDDVARYAKVRALADHVNTPPSEAANARTMCEAMETNHPGIAFRAALAQKVVNAPPGVDVLGGNMGVGDGPRNAAGGRTPTWQERTSAFLQNAFAQGASQFADEVAGAITGEGRMDALKRNEVAIRSHACLQGQACIEVRVNARDFERVSTRTKMLDAVEEALLEACEDA